jgi:hypothetical protein
MVKYQLLSKITETLARDDSVPAHPIEEIEE